MVTIGLQSPSSAELYAREFVYPDDSGVVASEIDKSMKTSDPGYFSEIEHRIVRRDGEVRHIVVRYRITKDGNGKTIKTNGVNQDITDRKVAEELQQASHDGLTLSEADLRLHQTELETQNEELRHVQRELEISRDRYFDFYNRVPVGYLTISEDGLILSANLTATTLLNVDKHHLVKKPVTRYIVPDDQDIFYLCRKHAMQTMMQQSCELRMKQPGGSLLRVQMIMVPAQDGGKISMNVTVIDLSTHNDHAEKQPG